MFIAVNTIKTEASHLEKMEKAFEQMAPRLNHLAGFAGFELWKSEGQLKAVTKWESKQAFDDYLASDMFKSQHGGEGGEAKRPDAQVETFDGVLTIDKK